MSSGPPGTGIEVLTPADLDLPVGTPVILGDPQAVDDRRIVLAAAAGVNVHPNTFRYRSKRISEVFSLLMAELELRLLPRER
ncbi:hypothetical protein ACIBHX_49120 [Nonomuraea sp. NPDC050536]|uniref:hypothetical protein n=1 Tax=Nonomuraea sp. NPDC050536 TaxID=3364366 RepID=UPI0037C78AFA